MKPVKVLTVCCFIFLLTHSDSVIVSITFQRINANFVGDQMQTLLTVNNLECVSQCFKNSVCEAVTYNTESGGCDSFWNLQFVQHFTGEAAHLYCYKKETAAGSTSVSSTLFSPTTLTQSLSTAASTQTKSCSGGWTEALGACYLLFTYSAEWSDARDTCVSYGGHLVVITSLPENDAVINLVNSNTDKSFWTGGYYNVEVGSWLWTNGETWSFSNFKTTPTENDNMRLAITKLDYNPSRGWFARYETNARIFLCEK